jgi:peptidoglycan/LPS O-acetylase OafA/YrhL
VQPQAEGTVSDELATVASVKLQLALASALDVAAVLVFVGIGRSVHTDGVTVAGMATTAWPFLGGAGVGYLVARGWRRPTSFVPAGVSVWLGCVVVGMALRVVSGQGTAVAFVGVALGFLGMEMLGWRLVGQAVRSLPRRDRHGDRGLGGAPSSPIDGYRSAAPRS